MESQKPKRKNIIVGGIITALAFVGIANASQPAPPLVVPAPAPAITQQPEKPKVLPAQTETPSQTTTPTSTPTAVPAPAQTAAPVAKPAPTPTPEPAEPITCPSGYYINVNGNCIQSPTASPSAPAGATAECRDGTYSFSQNHSGTCSHHGGVARWL
jgi:outer membrane biosynthesis protein TonB